MCDTITKPACLNVLYLVEFKEKTNSVLGEVSPGKPFMVTRTSVPDHPG
jgi:hypothetical protein